MFTKGIYIPEAAVVSFTQLQQASISCKFSIRNCSQLDRKVIDTLIAISKRREGEMVFVVQGDIVPSPKHRFGVSSHRQNMPEGVDAR